MSTNHEFDYFQNEGIFKSDSIQLEYTCLLDNLLSNTKYYVKAYAINTHGIGYGIPSSFITLDSDFILEYVSGNFQKYFGGGMPEPMVFRVKNSTDNFYVGGLLFENDLKIEASAGIGYKDGDFSHDDSQGGVTYYKGYWYVDSIKTYNPTLDKWEYVKAPYVLKITVSLKRLSNNRLLATYLLNQYIE